MIKPLIELIKENAHFEFYRDGALYYRTDSGFRFTVPVADTGTGTFLATDRGIFFMRWIRPQHQALLAIGVSVYNRVEASVAQRDETIRQQAEQIATLTQERDEARKEAEFVKFDATMYCPNCGACGIEGCCPAPKCAYFKTYTGELGQKVIEAQEEAQDYRAQRDAAEARCATLTAALERIRRDNGDSAGVVFYSGPCVVCARQAHRRDEDPPEFKCENCRIDAALAAERADAGAGRGASHCRNLRVCRH